MGESDDALFAQRVKQINRDCLATFMPYIKLFAGIFLFTGLTLIGTRSWICDRCGVVGERGSKFRVQ